MTATAETTSPTTPKPPKKSRHDADHVPVVPGTRRQAIIFSVIVILMTLMPFGLGLNIGKLAPRLPSLDWTLAIDQRTAKIAESITGKKILFIGGSNLRFGLDAKALTKKLGVPVVNYGLHASLGIDVIADRAATFIKPGDVVVFAPELSHFRKAGAANYSDDLRIDFLAEHPSAIDEKLQSFPTREWRRARSRCNRIRGKFEKKFDDAFAGIIGTEKAVEHAEKPAGNPYDVDAIGPDGELIIPRPEPRPYARWTVSDPPANVDAMDLNDGRGAIAFKLLSKICKERGAMLCVMPPMRLAVAKFDQAELLKMEQAFIDFAVKNGSIELMPPGENVLPIEFGYDTDYHLNDKGVALMEPRIAAALRKVIR